MPAHLTLFHHLPGEQRGAVEQALAQAADCDPVCLAFVGLRAFSGGVAYEVASPGLHQVRAALRSHLDFELTAQDRAKFQPHVTVQNKVPAATARALHQKLSADFTPWTGTGEALCLSRYDGGPWTLLSVSPFRSAAATSHPANTSSASA